MSVAIKGAKKGGGSSRKPVVAPDSAQSKTFIKIMYGLSEGKVKGLLNGHKSIYLDDTPLHDASGNWNFQNVQVDFRYGTNDQTYIEGFPSVESETGINVELKSDAPWVQAFSNTELDAVRVRLKWGPIRKTNAENGDISGHTIKYAIDVQTGGGAWTEVLNTQLSDKTSANYERSHRIDLPKTDIGWQIRVRRITPNSTSEYISDKMYVQAVTEIVDAKLRYPNTALLGLQYDAETFSNVAKLAVEMQGVEIRVPTNYNPETRTYLGFWDGTFKRAYTDNPAWHFYDACISKRYALGDRIDSSMIDKWSVYRLANYCDQLVSDGKGGQEPRFTLNVYEQQQDDAWSVLSKMAGAFRAYIYWDGQAIVCDADIPQDTYFTYTRANVIDGIFEYSGTRARDRHTVAKVAWDNPKNRYKTEHVIVRDEAAIAKLGIRIVDIQAYGCTSEGQAQRAGQWALKSEQLETRTVSFKVGLDGFIPMPGKVIEVADELFAGRANGGRISAVSADRKTITVDRDDVVCRAGDRLVVNGEDGKAQARIVSSKIGRKITVTVPFDAVAAQNIWVVDAQDLATMKFRVISITQDDKHQFSITALQYNPQKYDAIDHGAFIDDRPISIVSPTTQAAVTDVQISSETMVQQGLAVETMLIHWTQASGATKYQVEWRKDDGNWIKMPITGNNSVEVQGIYSGNYEARVIALSAYDVASLPTYSVLTTLSGKTGLPPALANLAATGILFGYRLDWNFPAVGALDTAYTEIEIATTANGANAAQLGLFAYPTDTHVIQGMQPNLTRYFRGRLIDRIGNIGPWSQYVSATTSADASAVLDILSGKLTETQLHQDLQTKINKIDSIAGLDGDIGNLVQDFSALQSTVSDLNAELDAETAARILAVDDLNDGLTQEVTDRQMGDAANLTALNNYKSSNDAALANVQQQVNTAVTEAAANSEAVQALDSRVTTAETNANTAKTNAATAITKADTAATAAGSAANLASQASAVANQAADTADTASQTAASALSTANVAATQSSANATQINALTVDLGTKASTAALDQTNANVTEINGRVTANTTKIDGVYAQVNPALIGSSEDYIGSTSGHVGAWSQLTAQIEGDEALGQRVDAVVAQINENTAAITAEATARANSDSVLTTQINTALSEVDNAKALIRTEQQTRADADGALGSRVDTVQSATVAAQNTANTAQQAAEAAATAAGNKGEVIFGSTTPTAEKRLSQNLWIDTTGGLNTPKRWNGSTWVAVTDKAATDAAAAASAAQATATEALNKANTATQNIATVQTQVNTLTTQQSATASQVGTLQTTVGNNTASIQTVSESVNGLYAQKYIKLDVNGKVAGWGGANTGKESDFIMNFDSFAIGSGNSVAYYPFIFRTTAYTDPNTGTVFPVGAYMKSAFIDYASIDTAHIKQLAVKSAQINNLAVTTGKIDNLAVTTGKIDNLAVTTGKIDNLAVTTAKIGDLQVDTLKIKDDAVSIGIGAQGVHTLNTVSNGGKIRLDIGMQTYYSAWNNDKIYLRVLRNGTVIRVFQFTGVEIRGGSEGWSPFAFAIVCALPPIIETIPAGTTVTYSIQIGLNGTSYGTPDNTNQSWIRLSNLSMSITELKK
ncbi:TipJ family phage tail tip protein [Acinetobacter towneri]|uniref:Phage tail protein n=1 Tax=Acinetobacter towneri TaxID=202956 RepID=A0AB35LXQ0_9GAMM|nr:phage tail protein [Acinetobacter towneri]MDM1718030.1 phage tail protein [Acinetobacter towneri]MDM1734844.1 phage tail protein [Acinetobacter towneri]MDM1738066.1 phage tail protein [Acinetobacter towneri]MDM1741657.1 phage tail protein [Acinetobacter towneri]MDM1745432.1 phage tail protein [Acinetobacter towneri]